MSFPAMNNGRQTPAVETAADSSSSAFSFISKGWREVCDSADADLRLMKDRANSFKNIAASFDREIENLINSATPAFTVPPIRQSSEIEFMKKLHPKISEFRRVYSAPGISRKVMEKCGPRANLGIDLSRIRSTIAAEVFGTMEEDMKGIIEFNKVRSEKLNEEGQFGEWEPIRVLKTRFREFEKKNSTVEKVKSSLASFGCTLKASEVQLAKKIAAHRTAVCLVQQHSSVEMNLHHTGLQKLNWE